MAVWFRRLVTENRKSREQAKVPNNDIMQMMMELGEKHGISVILFCILSACNNNIISILGSSDLELASHALNLYLEGFETSSSVLGFLLYEIARHPEIQERLYSEATEVFAKHDNKLTYEALQDMTYLDCVLRGIYRSHIDLYIYMLMMSVGISESQRLNTIALYLGKVCTQTYALPIFGDLQEPVVIHPGTTVVIPTMAIHL